MSVSQQIRIENLNMPNALLNKLVLGLYSCSLPIVESVNIIYIIITVIILIQVKQRRPRSGVSRNPDLLRWLLGSLSLHFGKVRGDSYHMIGLKLKTGSELWQINDESGYLPVWTYMERGSLVPTQAYSTWWRGDSKIFFWQYFCTRLLLIRRCRGGNLGSSELTLWFFLPFAQFVLMLSSETISALPWLGYTDKNVQHIS